MRTDCQLGWVCKTLGALLVATVCAAAHAFEIATHVELSLHALRNSEIGKSGDPKRRAFMQRIGFVDPRELGHLGDRFVEFDSSTILYRSAHPFERGLAALVAERQELAGRPEFAARELLDTLVIDGAIREDDIKFLTGDQPT